MLNARQYIREAELSLERTETDARNALERTEDTASRLALGQALLRLQDAKHELGCAREMLAELAAYGSATRRR